MTKTMEKMLAKAAREEAAKEEKPHEYEYEYEYCDDWGVAFMSYDDFKDSWC